MRSVSKATVVGEERGAAHALGEAIERDRADRVALRPPFDGGYAVHRSCRELLAQQRCGRTCCLGTAAARRGRPRRSGPCRRGSCCRSAASNFSAIELLVGRAHDEHDALPEPRVLDAEGDRVAHEPGAVDDLLDLGRADPVAGGLDHLVVAPDEVEEALLVGLDDVARPHRELRVVIAGGAARGGRKRSAVRSGSFQ